MATFDKNFKVKNGIDIGGTATATLFSGSGASLTNIPNSALTNSSITVNGSPVSLGGTVTIDALPSQSGQSGKYLTTNGTVASWETVSSYSAPTIGSTQIASGATVTTIAGLTLTSPTISTIINTGTLTLPTSTDTLVGRATTDTLSNKTITFGNNTVSGTLAQFNTAVTDADLVSLTGTETLTNKTLISAIQNTPTINDGTATTAVPTFFSVSPNSTKAMTSTDGITWTIGTMPSSSNWRGGSYGNGVFVVVTAGTTTAASSTDGITWTTRTMPSNPAWIDTEFGNGIFVSIAQSSSSAASSTDGITWTLRTLPISKGWWKVAFGNGFFFAIAQSTTSAASSTDGITWTTRTMPSNAIWNGITFGNGTLVVITNGTTAVTSTDGITWTTRTLPTLGSGSWQSIAYGNGVFAAVSTTGTAAVSSTDGITWTLRTLPASGSWYNIAFGNGIFTAAAFQMSTAAASSTDGITWTLRTLPASGAWYKIAYGTPTTTTSIKNVVNSVNAITAGSLPSVTSVNGTTIPASSTLVTTSTAYSAPTIGSTSIGSGATVTTIAGLTLTSPTINSPTGITKSDVGLSNVDNTSDANKPISTATQTALDLKSPLASPTFTGTVTIPTLSVTTTATGITKSMVGLGNVDNTSDADKPVSTATQTALNNKLSLSGGTLTGSLTLAGAPTSDLHAATKAYVDAATAGLNVHDSVKAATTANIDLSTALENGDILDGVTLATGNRVLVKNQTTKSQNGVYTVQVSGAAVRSDDYNTAGEVDAGDFIFVEGGTINGKTGWVQTNTITTLDTDNIEFTQFSGAGTYSAGTGLTLTGNTFSINTGTTVDLSTSQTLTNKTISGNSNTISLRANTASGWISADPILASGEIGFETDTLKFKLGNGSAWTAITTYANVVPSDLNTTLNGYLLVDDLGTASGPAQLDGSQNLLIPNSSIIFEGVTADSYQTTLTVTDPTADRTITLPNVTGTVVTTGNTSDAFPSQTGNSGKYLTTDGSGTLSWGTVSSYSAPTIGSTQIASGSTVTTIAGLTLTSPTISTITNTGTLTLPTSTDTLVGRATTDTLTNKTLSSATLTGTLTAGGVTGTNGQVLQSTGTGVQWGTVSEYSAPTIGTTSIGSGATITSISGLTLSGATLTGTLTAGGVTGTNGQVLQSTGTGVQWSAVSAPASVAGVRTATPFQAKQSFIGSNNIIPIYTLPSGIDSAIDSLSFTNLNAGTASVKLYLTNKNIDSQKFVIFSISPVGAPTTIANMSTDGITWNATTLPSALWQSGASGKNIFVAISKSTTAASSTDGITWTTRTMPVNTNWSNVVYGNNVFAATSSSVTTTAAYSTDGITWSTTTLPVSSTWRGLTYGNGIFVAVTSQSSTSAATCTDGITWTLRTLPSPGMGTWQSLAYGNGVFALIPFQFAAPVTTAASSTDGITWTIRTMPSAVNWNAIAYGNGVFVAIATNTTTAATSTDAITWTLRTMPSSSQWQAITYGNGLFVATIYGGGTAAASSTDGITWTTRTLAVSSSHTGVVSGHVQDSEIIYRNASVAANAISWIDANKYDPIFVPAGWSLIAQSSVSPVNIQLSGERWSNA